MIPDLIDNLPEDPWRAAHPFSASVQACHAALFSPISTRVEMADALSRWMQTEQPCLFGRMEARRNRLAWCLLTENDLERGDDHIRHRIHEDRRAWQLAALRGELHAFLIVAVSRRIACAAIGPELLALTRALCGLCLGADDTGTILLDDLMLEIRSGDSCEYRVWKVGANFFGAQGDGRWWRDHRIPGGIAFSMNSVGHMARHAVEARLADDPALAESIGHLPRRRLVDWALPTAMRSIGPPGIRSPQGTWLMPRGTFPEDTDPPSDDVRRVVLGNVSGFSENRYHGRYHTDETIPVPYFEPSLVGIESPPLRDELSFTYLHQLADPDYPSTGVGLMASRMEAEAGEVEGARHDEP